MSKSSKTQYYMDVAVATAQRGTCDRRLVGAVLVHGDRLLSTGFNGAPRGLNECDQVGHDLVEGSCVRSVHAEANALLEFGASRLRSLPVTKLNKGHSGITLYVTCSPCRACMGLIINAGVHAIVYGSLYVSDSHIIDRSNVAFQMAEDSGIAMIPHLLGKSFP